MYYLHILGVVVLMLTLIIESVVLFKYDNLDLKTASFRKRLLITQHSSFTLLLITGGILLYTKGFHIQNWFYAKIILSIVLVSALVKTLRVKSDILWVQRRGGIAIAWIAFLATLALVFFHG